LPNGDQFYGFPSEKDALKIGNTTAGRIISEPEERKPFGAYPTDGSEAFTFLRNILPGIGGLLMVQPTYDNTPMKISSSTPCLGMTTRCLSPGLAATGLSLPPCWAKSPRSLRRGSRHSLI
jgi:hypothetical protein